MKKIESERRAEFVKIVNESKWDKNICFVMDYEFDFSPNFLDLDWKCKLVVFKNCHFVGHLYFTNTNLGGGIQFEQCAFQYGLTFNNCTAGDHPSFLSDGSPFSVSFSGCEVNNRFIIKNCNLQHKILIHRDTKMPFLEFENSKMEGVDIVNSTVLGEVRIIGFNISMLFNFYSTTFHKLVKFSNCIGGYSLDQSTFLKEFSLYRCQFVTFEARETHCHGEVIFVENKAEVEVSFRDSTYERPVTMVGDYIPGSWNSHIEKLILINDSIELSKIIMS
ncbi:hypothetical protein ACUN24_20355 [Pedobacter sp. WC2501]|uniref:hypothetical protein n=1 Tax=Pedobacter sp. WC2501 TaxID=3461400 RepID=UPI004045D4B0